MAPPSKITGRATDARRRRRGAARCLLSAPRELSRDRGALAAKLPRRIAGARLGEQEALRAARIYARLALSRVALAAGDKTPMPPPFASARGGTYGLPPAIAGPERTASDLVRTEGGAAPQLEALLANGYEALQPCLPG
jgi:hypothetical protein